MTDPAALEEAIAQAMKSLRLVVRNGRPAHPRALRPRLRPEPSIRSPAPGRSGTPSSAGASASMMPVIPDDARIDYAVTPGPGRPPGHRGHGPAGGRLGVRSPVREGRPQGAELPGSQLPG
ncbi:MAG: hypothetical protein MZV64_32795 [Ignavibacteriales bacterium]|nr:hypothetical protein [Ignavibacteriales bacterium]